MQAAMGMTSTESLTLTQSIPSLRRIRSDRSLSLITLTLSSARQQVVHSGADAADRTPYFKDSLS